MMIINLYGVERMEMNYSKRQRIDQVKKENHKKNRGSTKISSLTDCAQRKETNIQTIT